MKPADSPEGFLMVLAVIGATVGLGKLLSTGEKITFSAALGRAILNAAMGMAAGGVLLFAPDSNPLVLYSVAAGLASLGTSGFEAIVKRRLGGGEGSE
jgi:hypothetical protein